jgi:predicted kinase
MSNRPHTLADELNKLIPSSALSDGLICMLCGISGAGKTTTAKLLEARGFVRLSIDEWIWGNYGRFGIDYPPESYPGLQVQAEAHLRLQLVELMRIGQAVVVDFSFWQRSRRDAYRQLIEQEARPSVLLYLKASKPLLLERLEKRRARFDANAAFPIDDEMLERYIAGFEEPSGEGELIVSPAI